MTASDQTEVNSQQHSSRLAARDRGTSSASVAIIGAGIGGLTTALALKDVGFEVTVYEQAQALESLGAGLQLSPNATRILHALGLKEQLARSSFFPKAVHFRSGASGYLIAYRHLGAISEARYGAPYYHIHRGDLQNLLLNALSDKGITLQLGRTFKNLHQGSDTVNLIFEDNTQVEHDLLIGCDGIRSQVRQCLFGEDSARFSGHVAWRGLIARAAVPDNFIQPAATVWLGPGKHFVHYYVRGGELINYVAVVETNNWSEESWTAPGDKKELTALFHGWHASIPQLIEASDDCFKWALYEREPLIDWTHQRATLLGDACHPMLPYLAQGAGMAIEDAWVLSRLLERWEDEPTGGLQEYQKYRQPRTRRVQLESRRQGDMFHLTDKWAITRRNLKLGFGCRYLPEIAMQHFDWLHGYDAVKAFD